MRIFVKRGEEVRRQMLKKVAPLSARRDLQENIRRERENLRNSSIQDKWRAQKEAKKWEDTLENSRPETLTVEAKNAMWKRAKLLKDEFTVGMLSNDELHPVSKIEKNGVISTVVDRAKMKSLNSVSRQMAWNKKNETKVREYKNIMRHLMPDDPSATDIEKYRGFGKTG